MVSARAKLADDGNQSSDAYLDCDKCTANDAIKRRWRCGWLSERDRTGEAPVPSSYKGERPDVCPGYLIRLPQVIEAARATSWRKEGALREFYNGQPLTQLTRTCIDLMAGEMRAAEQQQIRDASKRG